MFSSAAYDLASLPLPSIGSSTTATRWFWLYSTLMPLLMPSVCAARAFRSAIAPLTSGVVTSLAAMTTCSGASPPGNAFCIFDSVFMIGVCGSCSMPEDAVCMPSAGIDSATRRPVASTAATSGRRITGRRMADHTRDSVRRCMRLPRNGIRPRSTPSPTFESMAGSTVIDPSIAIATTMIEPGREPGELRVTGEVQAGHGGHHRQARDEHGAARRGGGGVQRGFLAPPGLALFTLAPDVEQRVVHADGKTDEQDDVGGGVAHRHQLADDRDETHRAGDGGEAEQQREPGGHERAEGEQQDAAA